jgi:purine-binding chemotaxis protein CheW
MNNNTIQNQPRSIEVANSEGAVRTLQLLRAGSFHFGIFADEIVTIAQWRDPTPLPHAPKSVLGVVSLHGRMLTVLDLAAMLNTQAASKDQSHDYILALRGDEQLALAVDALGETTEFPDRGLAAPPESAGKFVLGLLHNQGVEISILNTKELFSNALQGRERRQRRF